MPAICRCQQILQLVTSSQVASLARADGLEVDDSKPYAELWCAPTPCFWLQIHDLSAPSPSIEHCSVCSTRGSAPSHGELTCWRGALAAPALRTLPCALLGWPASNHQYECGSGMDAGLLDGHAQPATSCYTRYVQVGVAVKLAATCCQARAYRTSSMAQNVRRAAGWEPTRAGHLCWPPPGRRSRTGSGRTPRPWATRCSSGSAPTCRSCSRRGVHLPAASMRSQCRAALLATAAHTAHEGVPPGELIPEDSRARTRVCMRCCSASAASLVSQRGERHKDRKCSPTHGLLRMTGAVGPDCVVHPVASGQGTRGAAAQGATQCAPPHLGITDPVPVLGWQN